ncbi:MAG: 50S ribosomal protein L29 [Dehalococcoidia bacterium]
MARQNATDARRLSDENLNKEINDAYRALFTLRFQHASRQLQNYRELPAAKRRIARLRTVKRERELLAAGGEE